MKVRFPNETFYDEMPNFDIKEFELIEKFYFECFGKYKGITIAIKTIDYNNETNEHN